MCDGGFGALENLKLLAEQFSLRIELEKKFLDDWAHQAEHLGEHRAADILSQAAFELGRSFSTLEELKKLSPAQPEATVARV